MAPAPAASRPLLPAAAPPAQEVGPLEEYGLERLVAVARQQQGKPSQAVVEAVFADVEAWSRSAPADDDRTLMVVTYPSQDKAITAAFPRPIGLI